jgi:acylglycerol lipase
MAGQGIRDLPEQVSFNVGNFINQQGIILKTFSFQLINSHPKAIVYLAHGYSAYTLFDWLLPQEPGDTHNTYNGSVIEGLVNAGFAVRSLDHQGHGYSEGIRCYFDSFDHLVMESIEYIQNIVRKENNLMNSLPCFLFGISMGGATCLKMEILSPMNTFAGIVLYAPMISLEKVKEQPIAGPILNSHLEPIASCISSIVPHFPIVTPAINIHNPLAQKEFDNDILTYSGNVRARSANEFMNISNSLLDGELTLIKTPFITFHSIYDSFTDPDGSQILYLNASSIDKQYIKIGLTNECDLNIHMWHSLSSIRTW